MHTGLYKPSWSFFIVVLYLLYLRPVLHGSVINVLGSRSFIQQNAMGTFYNGMPGSHRQGVSDV